MRSTSSKANTVQTFAKSPSILAKVATPFTSRKRNLSEFSIETNEPHRQYSPGDTVQGCVNIKVDKAINITHLVVCLHGFAKVFSNAKTPGKNVSRDGALMSSGSGKRGAEYFGNGFASLFEDEVALCGEGRLNAGRYKFEFQLELPSVGLPSSIDFERGTITYMLTSTMTKPTTISPTAHCHWKIKVIESIDIARLQPPKPRTVSLEAVSKKSRSKRHARRAVNAAPTSPQSDERTPDATTPRLEDDPPQSPAPSEFSSASATSSSTVSWQLRSTSSFGRSAKSDTRRSSTSITYGISASIELLRGGCLPGDILPLHIFVSHTKAVKSLQGIIITLYRLARVDTHPAIPIGLSQEGKKPEYEDYYPKSRTGLGGLSLSSAGSSRSFRQDLNQIFAPLIVDPRSLTAVVRTSIPVPEDLFPTINTVPGQMITFKYYVEVVVDLRGRLPSQDRVRSQFDMVNGATGYGSGDPKISGIDGSSGLVFPLASGFGCLDTSQIRRERSVVSWPFEVVVGTRDSERRRCKQNEDFRTAEAIQSRPIVTDGSSTANVNPETNHEACWGLAPYHQESDSYITDPQNPYDSPQYADVARTTSVPPPELEEEVDEKTRLRQAEERLLPSAPPGEPSIPETIQPSAPEAIDHEDFVYRYRLHQPVPSVSCSSDPQTIVPRSSAQHHEENQHPCELLSASAGPNDDKRELEMRRLQMATSSPEEDEACLEGPSQTLPQPTAPMIDDDEQPYGLHESHPAPLQSENNSNPESLPLYRR